MMAPAMIKMRTLMIAAALAGAGMIVLSPLTPAGAEEVCVK
jgi:hypothetical protein